MRAGTFAAVLGCALAVTSAAQAQKTVLPGYQTTPPPKSALPGNPTTPPPMNSPGMDGTLGSGSMERGSQSPNYNSGNTSPGPNPADARRMFEGCLKQNTSNNTVSGQGMAACVARWMPPDRLRLFNECWNDVKNSAWTCFDRTYR